MIKLLGDIIWSDIRIYLNRKKNILYTQWSDITYRSGYDVGYAKMMGSKIPIWMLDVWYISGYLFIYPMYYRFMSFLCSHIYKKHDWEDTGYGGPDSGEDSGYCKRCGWGYRIRLY